MPESFLGAEIQSQPECWLRAAELATTSSSGLPRPGERTAVVGCGTSWFMAMSYAARREQLGLGETDAFSASEAPLDRSYDRVLAITRSGTTTEVLDLLASCRERGLPTVAVTAVADSPVRDHATTTIALGFADERSVVQTRFATSALALLRADLGDDIASAAADVHDALETPLEDLVTVGQITFLGTGWTIGLAHEAALKTREAAQFWAEAYPAMDYRHGPISIAEPGRSVWSFGEPPVGLAEEIRRTGASLVTSGLDPMAQLVVAQRTAVELAVRRGLDPDRPRHLTRSVELRPRG